MRVKIGDTIYDSNKEPVMLILSDQDKELIANMAEDNSKYCSYPNKEEYTENNFAKIKAFMKI